MTTLNNYYDQVVNQISQNKYSIKIRNKQKINIPKTISPTIQALNYLMYQYLCDMKYAKKQKSIYYTQLQNKLFDYVIIPDDLDFNFSEINILQLLEFIQFLKTDSKSIINIIV